MISDAQAGFSERLAQSIQVYAHKQGANDNSENCYPEKQAFMDSILSKQFRHHDLTHSDAVMWRRPRYKPATIIQNSAYSITPGYTGNLHPDAFARVAGRPSY